jgi:hypothetical protein
MSSDSATEEKAMVWNIKHPGDWIAVRTVQDSEPMTEKPNSVCTCKIISSRQVEDGECLICGKPYEPVAEPAEPSASPLSGKLVAGNNLTASNSQFPNSSSAEPTAEGARWVRQESCSECDGDGCNLCNAEPELIGAAAPQPVAGEGPRFSDQYEGDWNAPWRETVTQDVIKAVQDKDFDKDDAILRSIIKPFPEGTPKLEEAISKIMQLVVLSPSNLRAILRPFITGEMDICDEITDAVKDAMGLTKVKVKGYAGFYGVPSGAEGRNAVSVRDWTHVKLLDTLIIESLGIGAGQGASRTALEVHDEILRRLNAATPVELRTKEEM